MSLLASDRHVVIVGLGITGRSCARYLQRTGRVFSVMDTRSEPPGLAEFKAEFPGVPVQCGGLQREVLANASEVWLSPGLSPREAPIAELPDSVRVRGDIDVFAEVADAPVVAITGTNGKSTVTTLVEQMAHAGGLHVAAGGNLGTPALDLLSPDVDLYVLELSSFQLETTERLGAAVATILNMSEDHLDRYPNMMAYHQAKLRVYFGCRQAVFNRQDPLSQAPLGGELPISTFGLDVPDLNQYGVLFREGQQWLGQGLTPLLPVQDLALQGRHNWANALAALALAQAVGIDREACLGVLRTWRGLPHRCEWIRDHAGLRWINDSKATNVSAAIAAIEGLQTLCKGTLWVLLGGVGKGQNFAPLQRAARQNRFRAVVFGQDRASILAALGEAVPSSSHTSLQTALDAVVAAAEVGDWVLLSPACASFDEFTNYEARGNFFRHWVNAL